MTVNEKVLRAHSALESVFAKSLYSSSNLEFPGVYDSAAGTTCFFGLALVLGASRRTGATCAAAFLRSK
jgi:hypothetical protein